MKQKDLILISVVIFISAVFSLVISNVLFASPKARSQNVEVVDAIDSQFPDLDKRYFNPNSIDPTQLIKIGDTSNNNPFNNPKKP